MNKVLILGGYGNFGSRIATALAKDNISIIIAGRNQHQAEIFSKDLVKKYPVCYIETALFDVNIELQSQLLKLKPNIVINTVGPFQLNNYSVAEACIKLGIHYIDLADGRDFVNGIVSLNDAAVKNNVEVISGASTVPCLSSAVIAHFKNEFQRIDSCIYGISPGQKTSRGIATVKSILSYLGKPLKPYSDSKLKLYGWQDLYLQKYPEIGRRWMANCDIPDLDLFPTKYDIKHLRFSAGVESSILHLGMWLTSYLIRLGLPINLIQHADKLLKFSNYFDRFGSDIGCMHMILKGIDHQNQNKEIRWFVIAEKGDGPQIPCIPSIKLTKNILSGKLKIVGAMPCVELLTLEEYLAELKDFAVKTIIYRDEQSYL